MSDRSQGNGEERTRVSDEPGRSTAEWVSLFLSLGILVAAIGLVIYVFWTDPGTPAALVIEPRIGEIRHETGLYYLPFEIENAGSRAARDVRILVTLALDDGTVETAILELPVLTGGARVRGTVVFHHDPATARLAFSAGFIEP